MEFTPKKAGSLFFLTQGMALFAGSFVLEIDGIRAAGIGLAVFGAILLWGPQHGPAGRPLSARGQYLVYSALCLTALALTFAALPSSGDFFRRFLGAANPLAVAAAASIIGAGALYVLQSRFGFTVLKGRETLRGIGLSAVLATVMAVAIVIADVIIRYPQNMNAPMPQALLVYPAIGFVAEIVFFALPLAVLLAALSPLTSRLGMERVVWLGMLAVAFLEPTFQVLFEENALTWGDAYTWVHVFVIAVLQLYVFKRYDFVSMYSLRVIYYAYWHMLWGAIRLDVLF